MKHVVSIESPYHSTNPILFNRNINYAILAVKDSCDNYDEAPFASHIIYTQLVKDGHHVYTDNTFDQSSIANSIRQRCDKIVCYVDFGWSTEMLAAKKFAQNNDIIVEERTLPRIMLKKVFGREYDDDDHENGVCIYCGNGAHFTCYNCNLWCCKTCDNKCTENISGNYYHPGCY